MPEGITNDVTMSFDITKSKLSQTLIDKVIITPEVNPINMELRHHCDYLF